MNFFWLLGVVGLFHMSRGSIGNNILYFQKVGARLCTHYTLQTHLWNCTGYVIVVGCDVCGKCWHIVVILCSFDYNGKSLCCSITLLKVTIWTTTLVSCYIFIIYDVFFCRNRFGVFQSWCCLCCALADFHMY